MPVDVRQSVVPALMEVGESLVIHAHQMQDGGMNISYIVAIFDRMEADFIRDLLKPNIEGLWHILDAARLAGVKRFIFASSTNVAFGATELPRLTTDTVHVFNPYGATKAFGENLGRWFHDTYGLEFLAVRIGYFSGLSVDPALCEAWLHRIWLGPKDCAKFFRLAVAAPSFGYGIAYACSRCPENYLDLTSARALIGYEPEETVPDAP